MITIRQGIFETNSSSTHSICICTEEVYDKWVNGELYLNECSSWQDEDKLLKGKEFITKEEAVNFLNHYEITDDNNEVYTIDSDSDDLGYTLRGYDIYSFDCWGEDYEHDCNRFTTPSGDKMVIECYYGYN